MECDQTIYNIMLMKIAFNTFAPLYLVIKSVSELLCKVPWLECLIFEGRFKINQTRKLISPLNSRWFLCIFSCKLVYYFSVHIYIYLYIYIYQFYWRVQPFGCLISELNLNKIKGELQMIFNFVIISHIWYIYIYINSTGYKFGEFKVLILWLRVTFAMWYTCI